MNDSPPPAAQLPDTRWGRIRHYYERHEQAVDLAAFVGGFVFDMAMLDRIDAWATIVQQAAYLALIAAILLQLFFAQEEAAHPAAPAASRLARWVREYRVPFVHFLLGTLLNLYTLFFFKSASLFVSFGFMLVLAALLAANESKRAKTRLGLTLKFALFSLCLLAFSAAVVPVFIGSIGLSVFLLSMLAGCVPVAVMYRRILIHAPQRSAQARKQILLPFGAVLAIFLGLYLFRLIPPVPLSIPFMGVYHDVARAGDEYRLSHERPFWRVWDNGDQKFAAQPGDRIFVYFRIFSPARFADEVRVRWYWKDGQGRWKQQDAIPIRITGGREEGFRGYGMKTNYQAGDWKVQVDTLDEREIGRIYFAVTPVPAGPRSFTVDVQ